MHNRAPISVSCLSFLFFSVSTQVRELFAGLLAHRVMQSNKGICCNKTTFSLWEWSFFQGGIKRQHFTFVGHITKFFLGGMVFTSSLCAKINFHLSGMRSPFRPRRFVSSTWTRTWWWSTSQHPYRWALRPACLAFICAQTATVTESPRFFGVPDRVQP